MPPGSSGYSIPESELESSVPVHPTAVRHLCSVVVPVEKKTSDNQFTAKFVNRGASVHIS
jgi:hypothetical protein